MVDWLRPFFGEENEIVDLFYAIANCQGWVKTTRDKVIVRLEPLEQRKRRMAQEQLCRKLTNLGAVTPKGKWMVFEVGDCSLQGLVFISASLNRKTDVRPSYVSIIRLVFRR
jgi:hypothetical protein